MVSPAQLGSLVDGTLQKVMAEIRWSISCSLGAAADDSPGTCPYGHIWYMVQGRPLTVRQVPVWMDTSGMQLETALRQQQTAEKLIWKDPTLFWERSAKSVPTSLLRPAGWTKKQSECTHGHVTIRPSCGQPGLIVWHSRVGASGQLEGALLQHC